MLDKKAQETEIKSNLELFWTQHTSIMNELYLSNIEFFDIMFINVNNLEG